MIKLFRNIRKNLLNEGKTTKYFKYAIGEIVLVVIGILIALSINNWNENRKLQIQELNLTKQLLQDAKADSVFFESRVMYQKIRDTIFNNLLNLHKQITVDSISKLTVNDDPFFSRLAYQSNLINNNPDAYDLINDNGIKSKLRDYQAKYDYVVHSIELNNRICEENGIPLQIKYYEQLEILPETPIFSDLYFVLEDIETIAKFELFKNFGNNYFIQTEKFLKTNNELILLLETYIEDND